MRIRCTNAAGEVLFLTEDYKLLNITGLGSDFDVYTSRNSGQDGESYAGAAAKKRNIVLIFDVYNNAPTRDIDALYNFFRLRTEGEIEIKDGIIQRKATYYPESVTPSGNHMLRTLTVSLICPDAYFYGLADIELVMASWEGLIRFPLQLKEPFHVERRIQSLNGTLTNPSSLPMGLVIDFYARGAVTNPVIYDASNGGHMRALVTLNTGQTLRFITGDGKKRVVLIEADGTQLNANGLMEYPIKWLQAPQGETLYAYDAAAGRDFLDVKINAKTAYLGA